ncbi:MAG: type I polyketide synthase [Verrucomicrobia bacterium]|nr:type I polyketide synthase [Verrucomicrobiota bacterium]
MSADHTNLPESIAIIGLSGRFPGAPDVAAFWRNLCSGVESITRFTEAELLRAGADPREIRDPSYVPARAVIEAPDQFDGDFFGFTPRDAELIDPQHRLFLECAWEALEDAGYDPIGGLGNAGVFAGCSLNTYLLGHVFGRDEVKARFLQVFQADGYNLLVGNDKDYLATRVAYKLNLRGPALTIQTGCSTSLVAICQACTSLLTYQCDLALAGGASISFPQERGHLYQEGAIPSADGHCRAFDAEAQGTVFGAGVGVVALKRYSEAVAAGDPIYARIIGQALNNDGSSKVSYLAPSVDGQAEVISLAHAIAGITADTIGYIEAHGTGTPLGDPIEIAGLTQAFRATTGRCGYCRIGSLKTNVGHLEAAAGVAGLIKVALMLKHGLMPPSLHYQKPNPKIDFAASPFEVNTRLTNWPRGAEPRRAGLSSFGVGGTNAHVVLEDAPERDGLASTRPAQLMVLSAKTEPALEEAAARLLAYLKSEAGVELADVAYTLQTGRHAFAHRCAWIVNGARPGANDASLGAGGIVKGTAGASASGVVFLFPGQGSQHVRMAAELYELEPVFRREFEQCAELFRPLLGLDLRRVIYPADAELEESRGQLAQTCLTQTALFSVEYALARLWMSWGVQPSALVGHSIGEYVAAVLAGVMSLQDGIRLVAARGRLMQALPGGGMLSVRLPEAELRPMVTAPLGIAAINSPRQGVVSGPTAELESFRQQLEERGIGSRRLRTSHAFHSPMMEPMLAEFEAELSRCRLGRMELPILSTLTGDWLAQEGMSNQRYWLDQIKSAVRFSDAAARLVQDENRILLEVGPGQTLSTLVQQQPQRAKQMIPSLPPVEKPDEYRAMLRALGRLWANGVPVDWTSFHAGETRRRVCGLPTYPFQRRRYWLEAAPRLAERKGSPLVEAPQFDTIKDGPATATGTAGADPLAGGSECLEQAILEQLRSMSQQLAVLGGSGRKEQADTGL